MPSDPVGPAPGGWNHLGPKYQAGGKQFLIIKPETQIQEPSCARVQTRSDTVK